MYFTGRKTANKNIEVTMQVLSEDGTVLPVRETVLINTTCNLVAHFQGYLGAVCTPHSVLTTCHMTERG